MGKHPFAAAAREPPVSAVDQKRIGSSIPVRRQRPRRDMFIAHPSPRGLPSPSREARRGDTSRTMSGPGSCRSYGAVRRRRAFSINMSLLRSLSAYKQASVPAPVGRASASSQRGDPRFPRGSDSGIHEVPRLRLRRAEALCLCGS